MTYLNYLKTCKMNTSLNLHALRLELESLSVQPYHVYCQLKTTAHLERQGERRGIKRNMKMSNKAGARGEFHLQKPA